MTTSRPEPVPFEEGLKKLARETGALRREPDESDNAERAFIASRREIEEYNARISELKINENEGRTRNSLGGWIISTFCVSSIALVLWGCGMAAFSDETHMKNFVSFVQVVGTLLSGAVGFVLGHYFTSKSAR